MKKTGNTIKPRNPRVAMMMRRKAGAHQKTNKAVRKKENDMLKKCFKYVSEIGAYLKRFFQRS